MAEDLVAFQSCINRQAEVQRLFHRRWRCQFKSWSGFVGNASSVNLIKNGYMVEDGHMQMLTSVDCERKLPVTSLG